MSESSGDTKTAAPLAEGDPLAELAKLVSAGSVFGNATDHPAQVATNDPHSVSNAGLGEQMDVRLTAPAAEALEASNSSILDLDAELGAQLEAELVSELYENEASSMSNPQEAMPAYTAPQAEAYEAAPVDMGANADEKISSALDEALNLDGFISDTPMPTAIESAPDLEPSIDFDSFEAEISAAATSGFPSVDVPTPNADFVPTAPVEPSVEPMVAAMPTPEIGVDGIPADMPVGDIDPLDNIQFETAEDDYAADYDNDNKSNSKGILAIAAVLLVALVGGAGAFFIGAFGDGSSEPVVIAADDEPVRIKPDDPGGREIPNQDRTVYNTLDGEEDTKQESRLVVRSEEPVVNDSDRPRVILPNANADNVSATTPPTGPRTVKTVIVRPDGTLVRPDSDAAADVTSNTPSETSIVDASETAVNAAEQEIAAAGEELTPRAVSTEALSLTPENASEETAPAQEAVQVAALPPIPRANNNRNQTTAAPAQPTQAATPTAAPAANTGDFVVQLSAQRSDEAARTNFRRLQQRYSVLAGYSLNVQRADLGDRGVYHRVRVGPFARSAANTLCERVKSQGGDCIVRRQ